MVNYNKRIIMIRFLYMNDTITLSKRQQEILYFCIFSQKLVSSSDILEGISSDSSLITIKRDVSELFEYGYIIKEGAGTKYTISTLGRINTIINIQKLVK